MRKYDDLENFAFQDNDADLNAEKLVRNLTKTNDKSVCQILNDCDFQLNQLKNSKFFSGIFK